MSGRTGPDWGATAADWAELWADMDVPAREADGSYRFDNRFRYLIAVA